MSTLAYMILAQSQVGPAPSVSVMGVELTLVFGIMMMAMLVVRVQGFAQMPLMRPKHG